MPFKLRYMALFTLQREIPTVLEHKKVSGLYYKLCCDRYLRRQLCLRQNFHWRQDLRSWKYAANWSVHYSGKRCNDTQHNRLIWHTEHHSIECYHAECRGAKITP